MQNNAGSSGIFDAKNPKGSVISCTPQLRDKETRCIQYTLKYTYTYESLSTFVKLSSYYLLNLLSLLNVLQPKVNEMILIDMFLIKAVSMNYESNNCYTFFWMLLVLLILRLILISRHLSALMHTCSFLAQTKEIFKQLHKTVFK